MKYSKSAPVKIVVLGAGETGGYLIPHLYRIAFADSERPYRIIICDGDIVEEKNLIRQNFVKQDIGRNKAAVLGIGNIRISKAAKGTHKNTASTIFRISNIPNSRPASVKFAGIRSVISSIDFPPNLLNKAPPIPYPHRRSFYTSYIPRTSDSG